jgi:hypothetical protein
MNGNLWHLSDYMKDLMFRNMYLCKIYFHYAKIDNNHPTTYN